MQVRDDAALAQRRAQVRSAFDVLPSETWQIVERPPLGRADDVVSLVIGRPGVFVVHTVEGTGEPSPWTRAGRDVRRRTRDHVVGTKRQVRITGTRLSTAMGRIVVTRGLLVVTADVPHTRAAPVVDVLGLEGLPRLLLTTRDEVLTPDEVTRLAAAARDPETWRATALSRPAARTA